MIHNNGCEVLVGKITIRRIRHHGEHRAVVVFYALSNGSRDLIVGPVCASRFGVGCKIGCNDRAGEIRYRQHLAGQFHARKNRGSVLVPIPRRMAQTASEKSLDEVASPGKALWCALELTIGHRAFSSVQ